MELSIGEVAARTGLSVHTLRMYEREGLFHTEVRRDGLGRRVYGQPDLDWLDVCTKFRASGMPIESIRRFAALVRQGPGNEAERLELLRRHRLRVEEQLRQLGACLELIEGKVATYEEHVARGTAAGLWTG
ncbi:MULTISPECIES: MerR family transcriptional regulator [Dactylosporangium]|uniref:MerR family transcriptional regulator n=2 Tax=Dactylosporangium TaxID=35753 RepID=A0A9W6NSY7_9ACTN|nr:MULTISPECIES: MerR family transcriptional regulator [Dactylosporangium]UAC00303.1 MerR family transcriptional regulator [Dactylosporangium vinaceum]UWZ47862.1 MerR family transcriptional regulator [Dactylosporangium matsuzakiense]GLL07963.1 MerR family transcriptional regulator [Dactylosporangium matsuzakiense]